GATSPRAPGPSSRARPAGGHAAPPSHFGSLSRTATGIVITEGQPTTHDVALAPAPSHAVSGHVRNGSGDPLAGVTVTIAGTPIPPATTDAAGAYSFASVPEGEYDISARPPGGCNDPQPIHVVVNGDQTVEFTLPQRHDNFGYVCRQTTFDFIDAGTVLPLTGDDNVTQVALPFPMAFYGQT